MRLYNETFEFSLNRNGKRVTDLFRQVTQVQVTGLQCILGQNKSNGIVWMLCPTDSSTECAYVPAHHPHSKASGNHTEVHQGLAVSSA